MILCEWDAPEGHPGQVAYTCMLSYPIDVFHVTSKTTKLILLDSLLQEVVATLLHLVFQKPSTAKMRKLPL